MAADKNVPVERFAGKPVIFVKVADGINKPKKLIEEILSGKVPAYAGRAGRETTSDVADAEESLGRQIYKHLMNGVLHMLPVCNRRWYSYRTGFPVRYGICRYS